jgi:bacteriorhodopsin
MVRHIFNLETCISIVAAYFYGQFLEKLKYFKENNKPIDWKEMTLIRYLDWCITTPMMLIVLCVALSFNIKKQVYLLPIMIIIVLNYLMLGLGYLGDIGTLDKITASTASFISFFSMFSVIYYYYLKPKYNKINIVIFSLFLVFWSFYGIVYFLQEETKNLCFNVLDICSKCLVGIGLWIYYTRVIV